MKKIFGIFVLFLIFNSCCKKVFDLEKFDKWFQIYDTNELKAQVNFDSFEFKSKIYQISLENSSENNLDIYLLLYDFYAYLGTEYYGNNYFKVISYDENMSVIKDTLNVQTPMDDKYYYNIEEMSQPEKYLKIVKKNTPLIVNFKFEYPLRNASGEQKFLNEDRIKYVDIIIEQSSLQTLQELDKIVIEKIYKNKGIVYNGKLEIKKIPVKKIKK